jgi:hypothetical protein
MSYFTAVHEAEAVGRADDGVGRVVENGGVVDAHLRDTGKYLLPGVGYIGIGVNEF